MFASSPCILFVAVHDSGRVVAISDRAIERLDDEFLVAGTTAVAVLTSIAEDHPVADRLAELSPALSNDPPIAPASTVDVIANVAEDDLTAVTPTIDDLLERLEDDTAES
ncbi:hypothetical protein [Natrinema gelatinilyticum]|uniref:hypothetical protein n=1 Tax=Natrinema gelatinilyticum TaxID=2961571 RepID=UPI0020C59866|nr:hypothetical protein [Natrinema gelatinilyticum]